MNAPRQVQIVLPGVHEQLDEDGYRPPANRVRILPTEKRRAAARSRANERKEPHGRLQLHRRWLIARTFGDYYLTGASRRKKHVVISGIWIRGDTRSLPDARLVLAGRNRRSLSTAGNYYPSSGSPSTNCLRCRSTIYLGETGPPGGNWFAYSRSRVQRYN